MLVTNHSRAYELLARRWGWAFVLLGVSFVLFGLLSVNLLHLLSANLDYLATYGFLAVVEDGLLQLAMIVVSGYIAAACYLVFKLCEKVLVERLSDERRIDP